MNDLLLILLPGTMYFWVLFVAQGPMQEILQEKADLILPRLLAAPVTPVQYIVSKMLRCFALCSLAIVLQLVASALLFRMSWGSPVFVAAVVFSWSLSMTGLMALIFSLVRTREQSHVLAPVVLLLCAMLGGGMFPFEDLPAFLQLLGQYTPNRWAVVLLQGVARAKPPLQWTGALAALTGLGFSGIAVALILFKKQLTGSRS